MGESWITQWRKGLLDYCVLLTLSRGESYGYLIVQQLKQHDALAVSESTVYPILARLCRERLLKVRDVPSPDGPPRRYFALTALGKIRLAEMQAYWKLLGETLEQLASSRKSNENP